MFDYDIFNKIRRYEVRMKKKLDISNNGTFTSIFKGLGIDFDDVQPYQFGDDIRHIHWSVSAKGHGTFVKKFREDKEQHIYFILDISASQQTGIKKKKLSLGIELFGVLATLALKEGSHVGLACFTDKAEAFWKSRKGLSYGYYLIHRLINLNSSSDQTDLKKMIHFSLDRIHKKSLIFFISDFIDTGYNHHLQLLSHKHELVIVHLYDPLEKQFPKVGVIPFYDTEKKKVVWANTSSKKFRENQKKESEDHLENLKKNAMTPYTDFLSISTKEDVADSLVEFFKKRNLKRQLR